MFLLMGRWLFIWAVAGLALAGAAHRFSPAGESAACVRWVALTFPWAALWASLVAHAPLPSSLSRVHHVTVGAVLALTATATAGVIADGAGRLTPVSVRLLVLAGMAAALFAAFGTAWAVAASLSWKRTRKAGVLREQRVA